MRPGASRVGTSYWPWQPDVNNRKRGLGLQRCEIALGRNRTSRFQGREVLQALCPSSFFLQWVLSDQVFKRRRIRNKVLLHVPQSSCTNRRGPPAYSSARLLVSSCRCFLVPVRITQIIFSRQQLRPAFLMKAPLREPVRVLSPVGPGKPYGYEGLEAVEA